MIMYQMKYKWEKYDERWTYSVTKFSAKDFRKWWKRFKLLHGTPDVYEARQKSSFGAKWNPSKVKLA